MMMGSIPITSYCYQRSQWLINVLVGTGKTYTMGSGDEGSDDAAGIIPRAIDHIFSTIEQVRFILLAYFVKSKSC